MTDESESPRHPVPRAAAGTIIRAAAPIGAVLAALPALEVGTGPWIGASLAAGLVLGFHYRPLWIVASGLLIGGAANWAVASASANLTPYAADSMLTGLLLLGIGLGLLAGLKPSWSAALPELLTLRGEFLEFCGLAGLFAGFVFLRGHGLVGASEFAGRVTFGSALIGAVLLGPWILVGNAIRAVVAWLHGRRHGGGAA